MKLYFLYFILLIFAFFLLLYYNSFFDINDYTFCYGADGCDEKLDAADPEVISIFLRKYLVLPSDKPHNLTNPEETNPSMGQAQKIDEILKKKRNGFFIECGALDGETRSNTLFFEVERNWRGLLIEADPLNFKTMLSKNRHAFMSQSCMAPSKYPISVKFRQHRNLGHIVGKMHNLKAGPVDGEVIDAQCFPILTYIKGLAIGTVDYFSLDVEGAEFSILKEIPWDQVDIKTLSVEYLHDEEEGNAIIEFMEKQGYSMHSRVINSGNLAHDFIFVKKDLLSTL